MNLKKAIVPTISCFVIVFYFTARPLSEYGSVSPPGPIVSRVTIEPTGLNASPYADTSMNITTAMDAIQGAPKTLDDQTVTLNASDVTIDQRTEDTDLGENSASPTTAIVNEKKAVRFLYLVQTEGCLPTALRTNEALGNGNLDFHVLVLSYRQPCDDRSLPHMEYVFNASTTWTTGRNLLFTLAMKRNITYLYYIFMDDDATAVDIRTNAVAWRAFEGFLQSMEPAVMALDLPGQDYSAKVLQIHKDRGCVMEELEYVTGLWYDAMVNAFHYKAVKHLLPYIAAFDKQTWWASQMALIVRTEILFRGQLLLHRFIRCTGSQNRPYPRDLNFTPNMYSQFTQGLDAHIAEGCVSKCAQAMIERWMTSRNENGWTSSTLCLPPPPPHDPVEPCRYQCISID
ncbi:hypothetical protein EMCRGX_G000531 [Ephydatia muelleri]